MLFLPKILHFPFTILIRTFSFIILMNDEDKMEAITLESEGIETSLLGNVAKLKKYTKLFLADENWNISNVSVLLNELIEWKVVDRLRTRDRADGRYFVFHFINAGFEEIVISLRTDCFIEVKITTRSIIDNWPHEKRTELTCKGSCGRKLKNCVFIDVEVFNKIIIPKTDGSLVILKHKMPIFYNISSYSDVFLYFCKKVAKRIGVFNIHTSTFFDIYNTWLRCRKQYDESTEKSFLNNTEGFLKLFISDKLYKNKEHITLNEVEYSIISGIYISPYSESIIRDNPELIDGVIMDTTWKVLPLYVTSILMLSICNVGIPIGYCFGKAETCELYDMFFKTFDDLYKIKLNKFIIESDKGTALSAICSKYGCQHIGCLKHFVTSLGLHEFSKPVADLVSAKCEKDLEKFKKMYSEKFIKYIDTPDMQNLQKTLEKAGLRYDVNEHKILIANTETWNSISQIKRIEYSMPATTNALESSHGHLNSQVPRHNEFWSAMTRLVNFVIVKQNNFERAYQTNFARAQRKIKESALEFQSTMLNERQFYNTKHDSCECGETKLLSKMFRIEIPCKHIYSQNFIFPKAPEIKLKLKKSTNKLAFVYDIIETQEVNSEYTLLKSLQFKAVKIVKKYSHFKDQSQIQESLKDLQINDTFANGLPMSVHEAIFDGIEKFSQLKKESLTPK